MDIRAHCTMLIAATIAFYSSTSAASDKSVDVVNTSAASDKPVGVVNISTHWIKDNVATCPEKFSPPSIHDATTNIVYCVYRGEGPQYLQKIQSTPGNQKDGGTCLNKLGEGWTGMGYDDYSHVWMCKKMVNFTSIKAGESYAEDVAGVWRASCGAELTELWETPVGKVKFCASIVKLPK
jgi:hypothetical protein